MKDKTEKMWLIAITAMICIMIAMTLSKIYCVEEKREEHGYISGINVLGETLVETEDGHIWAVKGKLNTVKRDVRITFDTKHTKSHKDDEIVCIQ